MITVHLDLQNIIPSSLEKIQSKSIRPTAMITICNTTLNLDNVFDVLCPAGPSVKCKVLALPSWQVERLILKMYHDTTRRYSKNRTFTPILTVTEAKKAHFFVHKRTGFVNHMFWRLKKNDSDSTCESLIVTRVELNHLIKNVTRVESPKLWLESSHSLEPCHHWCTPQLKQARNLSQFFDRKSISRNTTHRQSLHLQAMLTGETLKGWNKGRESKLPNDCSE